MKTYQIALTWTVSGVFNVPANSLKEAIEKVEDSESPYDGLPTNSGYVDDSCEIDKDRTKELNNDNDPV